MPDEIHGRRRPRRDAPHSREFFVRSSSEQVWQKASEPRTRALYHGFPSRPGEPSRGERDRLQASDLLRRITSAIWQFAPSPVFGEKAGCLVKYALRNWKCRDCGRANATEVALDGTAKCVHCSYLMHVQPSRIRNGVLLPLVYPTRRGPALDEAVRSR